ncbi:MAG TPA: sulfite exporter TauE/SafE family protein [Phycisphaerales bacterium]|nr:sulfite exporter TauE/SafE family protein [Phycisphaerales bacterium]
MPEYLPLILLGFVIGTLGTLIGAGGGFILMPILLLSYPQRSAEELTAISLAVVFFNAASGSISYARMKRIDYRSGLLFLTAGIPGAVMGAMTVAYVPRQAFNTVFGLVLLAASLFILFRSPRPPDSSARLGARFKRVLTDAAGRRHAFAYNLPLGMSLSFLVGFASSLLGIGGGIIHVPAMVHLLDFPVHIATATSHFVLAGMALAGTLVHGATGSLREGLGPLLGLAVGAGIGAQIGARLSPRIHGRWIMRALAGALALVGIRILLAAVWS